MAGVACGIEPGSGGAGLQDAGDGVVGQPRIADAAAFPQRPEQRAFADGGGTEPGAQVGEGGQTLPFGHGHDRACRSLIGL